MRRSDKGFDGDTPDFRSLGLADPTQVDPNGARLFGLLSRLEDLVGDADVDVDAPIEDDTVAPHRVTRPTNEAG